MATFSLENKKILITGATSGIGSRVVEKVIEHGGNVFATGRNEKVLQDLQNKFASRFSYLSADLTQPAELQQIAINSPSLDGMVYSAGIVKPQPIRYLSRAKLEETMAINFYAPVELVAQLDQQKKWNKKASIAFISSLSAEHPHKGGTSYSASKSALDAFMKVVALEYSHREMRANSVAPGMVRTPLFEQASAQASAESMNEHLKHYPLGIGETDDVANAIIYLLSDASKWMTGQILTIDGGLLLGY